MYFTRQVHLGKAESTGTVLESNVHMLFKLIMCYTWKGLSWLRNRSQRGAGHWHHHQISTVVA